MPAARAVVTLTLAALLTYLLAPRGLGAGTVDRVDEHAAWALWRSESLGNRGYPTWAYCFLEVGGAEPARTGVALFLVARRGPDPRLVLGMQRLSPAEAAGVASAHAAFSTRDARAFDLRSGRREACQVLAIFTREPAAPNGGPAPVTAEASVCGAHVESRDLVSSGLETRVVLEDRLGP